MTQTREYEVSISGVIYWNVRDRLGRVVSRKVWEARLRLAAGRTRRAEAVAAYRAYLDARRDAAEAATSGHLVRDWSRSVTALFKPKASLRNASDELADWFQANGSTLGFPEFYAQAA